MTHKQIDAEREALLPCPFCGANAKYDPMEGEWVSCASMECDMRNLSVDLVTWQARAQQPALSDDEAVVKRIQNYYLPQLKFSMNSSREFAEKHKGTDAASHHLGNANGLETAIGCIEEALAAANALPEQQVQLGSKLNVSQLKVTRDRLLSVIEWAFPRADNAEDIADAIAAKWPHIVGE